MLKFFEAIKEFWVSLWPFIIINYHQRGVVQWFGKLTEEVLKPGIYWKWPFVEYIWTTTIQRETIELSRQEYTGTEITYIVSVAVTYQVSSAYDYVKNVSSDKEILEEVVGICVRELIETIDQGEIIFERFTSMCEWLHEKMEEPFEEYGVVVYEVNLKNFLKVSSTQRFVIDGIKIDAEN